MENSCLVSVTVLAYNSAATIIETLESIKSQTYHNIELIVSDDCSSDNTVELCHKWIDNNNGRFVRTELLTVERNTGVCANGNRALAVCRGLWKKGIAADDILLPNCIEDFIAFLNDNPSALWVSSYIREYRDSFDEANCIMRNGIYSQRFFDFPVEQQLHLMACRNVLYAPSIFFNVAMMRELGGFDEKYVAEDYVFYMRALEKGYRCYFMPKETVGYRIHNSLAHSKKHLFNYFFQVEARKMRKDLSFKYLTKTEKLGLRMIWCLEDIIEKMGLNKNTKYMNYVYTKSRNIIVRFLLKGPKLICRSHLSLY